MSLVRREVKFLGHTANREGIKPDPSKIESARSWPIPSKLKELRAFLGTCSYYKRFIKDFSKIAKPLHRLTEKNAPFQWTQPCQESFEHSKSSLISSPLLVYPFMEKQFYLIQMPVAICLVQFFLKYVMMGMNMWHITVNCSLSKSVSIVWPV